MLKKITLTSLLTASLAVTSFGQEITNWYQDKSSAVVITFDDWSPGHGSIAVPNMIEKDIPGTFFVTTVNDWAGGGYEQMQNALNNGIEIGNHTQTHPRLTDHVDNENRLISEILGTEELLERNIKNLEVTTFCYPLGMGPGFDEIEGLVKQYNIAARGIFLPPSGRWKYKIDDYYNLPTVAVNTSLSMSAFRNYLKNVQNDGGLLTYMYHSISNDEVSDSWWDEIKEQTFVAQLEELEKVKDVIWVTTLDKAIRYHKEKNSATLFEVLNTSSQRVFSLTDTLSDNTIFNQPLTIKIPVDEEVNYVSVEQDGITLEVREEGAFLYFDAIPDAGNIVMKKEVSANIFENQESAGMNASVFPNPATDVCILQLELEEPSEVSIQIVNTLGQIVKTDIALNQIQNVQNHTISLENLDKGLYYIRVIGEKGQIIRKVVKK